MPAPTLTVGNGAGWFGRRVAGFSVAGNVVERQPLTAGGAESESLHALVERVAELHGTQNIFVAVYSTD